VCRHLEQSQRHEDFLQVVLHQALFVIVQQAVELSLSKLQASRTDD